MKDGRFPQKSRDARRAGYWRNVALLTWLDGQNENKNSGPSTNGNNGCSKGCVQFVIAAITAIVAFIWLKCTFG